jgi:hypothetical protein
MAQSRLISSDIWSDDWFGPLPFFDQALWIGLFSTCADDQGRLLDNPILIRAAVFPYKDTHIEDIEAALSRFTAAGRLHRYQADGKSLAQIVNWWDHQRPQWAQPSRWPAPVGWQDAVRTRQNGAYVALNWDGSRGFQVVPSGEPTTLYVQVGRQDPTPDPVPNPTPDPVPAADARASVAQTPPRAAPEPRPLQPTWTRVLDRAGIIVNGVAQSDMWRDLAETADAAHPELFEKAIEAGVRANATSLRYVKAVVDRCIAEARMPDDPKTRGAPPGRDGMSFGQRFDATIAEWLADKQAEEAAHGNNGNGSEGVGAAAPGIPGSRAAQPGQPNRSTRGDGAVRAPPSGHPG